MSRELGTTQEWNDERGGASATRVSAQVLRVDLRDYLSEALGHILVEVLEAEFESAESLHLFFDAEKLDAYHSYVRIGVTGALLNNLGKLASVQVLARSTLVFMGVAVANLALQGRVKTFGTRAEFDAVYAAALGRAPVFPPGKQSAS